MKRFEQPVSLNVMCISMLLALVVLAVAIGVAATVASPWVATLVFGLGYGFMTSAVKNYSRYRAERGFTHRETLVLMTYRMKVMACSLVGAH